MREPFGPALLAAALLLASCGETPEAPALPEAPSAGIDGRARTLAEVDPDRPVILAFGNSLTEGRMVEPEESYPSQLQRLLEDAGYEHQVVNDGEDGLTTSGGLARLDRALALEPEMVILELGANDGLRGTPVETIRANLETLLTSFLDNGAVVVLAGITLPRNYGPDYIAAFESIYSDLAASFEVPFIPFLLEGAVDLEDPTRTIGLYMQADGTHPSAAGYEIVADTVFQAIRPYLTDSPR